jgi:hypothetical protein
MLTVTNFFGLKSTDICFANVTWAGYAPQVNAGANQGAYLGSVVRLDGSSSKASNGIAAFRWHQTRGAPVTLSDPTSASPYFTTNNVMPYGNPLTFQLTVADGDGLRSKATQVIDLQ